MIQFLNVSYNYKLFYLYVCIFTISSQMIWPTRLKFSRGDGVSMGWVVYSKFGEDQHPWGYFFCVLKKKYIYIYIYMYIYIYIQQKKKQKKKKSKLVF